MITDPGLRIKVLRTSLSLPELVFQGTRIEGTLGAIQLSPPARQSRIGYAPDSGNIHGSEPISWSEQQSILGWSWFDDYADDESANQASFDEVWAAITQFPEYLIKTKVSDAAEQVWKAQPGSMNLAANSRTFFDLTSGHPVYAITVPVFPIPGA